MKFWKLLSLLICLNLTGCLVPENFSTSIVMNDDGSYTYKYDGKAAHPMVVAAIKDKGALPAKDEANLKFEAEKMAKKPEFKKAKYLGNGRYEIQIEEMVKPGQSVQSFKLFTITKDKDGIYTVSAPQLKSKDHQAMKDLGIKVSGVAQVILPSSAKVIASNAAKTPGILSKAHEWSINSSEDKPSIRFTLK
jgi:hypothetical protein